MDGWMDGWMDRQVDRQAGGWVDRQMYEKMHGESTSPTDMCKVGYRLLHPLTLDSSTRLRVETLNPEP